jgi:hypothetical protein
VILIEKSIWSSMSSMRNKMHDILSIKIFVSIMFLIGSQQISRIIFISSLYIRIRSGIYSSEEIIHHLNIFYPFFYYKSVLWTHLMIKSGQRLWKCNQLYLITEKKIFFLDKKIVERILLKLIYFLSFCEWDCLNKSIKKKVDLKFELKMNPNLDPYVSVVPRLIPSQYSSKVK